MVRLRSVSRRLLALDRFRPTCSPVPARSRIARLCDSRTVDTSRQPNSVSRRHGTILMSTAWIQKLMRNLTIIRDVKLSVSDRSQSHSRYRDQTFRLGLDQGQNFGLEFHAETRPLFRPRSVSWPKYIRSWYRS